MIDFRLDTPLYEPPDPSYVAKEIETVDECLSKLSFNALAKPASAFSYSVRTLYSLLQMPHVISSYSQGHGAGYEAHSVFEYVEEHLAHDSPPIQELKDVWKSSRAEGGPYGFNLVSFLVEERDIVRDALESQLAFVTVAMWTILETLAKDAWIESVNAFPDPLASHALNAQVGSAEGAMPKSIKAHWLSKYGFDLRTGMGTVLAEDEIKFKFDNPAQIARSYKTVFKEVDSASSMWSKTSRDINLLNLVRNLVAHRAGVVDLRFKRQAGVNLAVGDRLPLHIGSVSQFLSLIVVSGCELLTLSDTWFSYHLSRKET